MPFDDWLLFASIALVATITPGPAILLVTSHSAAYGARHAVATMLGNVTGLFAMSLLSVLGLSALISHSAAIFLVVKLLGAVYLAYLGVKLWRGGFGINPSAPTRATFFGRRPQLHRLYVQGLLVALSNPKAIAFSTALFPQFIDTEQSMPMRFGILILTFMGLSFACLLAYALLIDRVKARTSRLAPPGVLSKLFGTAFIGSGVALATAGQG